MTRLALPAIALAVCLTTTTKPAAAQAANPYLEGALSGAAESYLENAFGSETVPYSKNWGQTARKKVGVKVIKVKKSKTVKIKVAGRVVGQKTVHYWEPQTRAVYKTVKNGTWMRGAVSMGPNLSVKIRNLRFANNTLRFRVEAYANIAGSLEARVYAYDRRLGSTRVRGRGTVRIIVNMAVSFRRSGGRIFWSTKAESTSVKIVRVTVDRVSHIGGYAAKVIGDAAHGMYRYWFTKKYNEMRRKAASAVATGVARSGSVKLPYSKLPIR